MSARDDYPRLAWIEQWDTEDGPECRQALDELDHLRGDVPMVVFDPEPMTGPLP